MVAAWYMSEIKDDQRFENQQCPPKAVSMDQLYRLTGVEYYNVSKTASNTTITINMIKNYTSANNHQAIKLFCSYRKRSLGVFFCYRLIQRVMK